MNNLLGSIVCRNENVEKLRQLGVRLGDIWPLPSKVNSSVELFDVNDGHIKSLEELAIPAPSDGRPVLLLISASSPLVARR